MVNGRGDPKKGKAKGQRDPGRDAGGFVALPWAVLDSRAYLNLSHPAKALLMEIARQFVRDNNGRLLASREYLATRGWKSADVIQRAKNALIAAGFIYETVKGHRPNKASWYAVTWRALDKLPGYDDGALHGFERGAYRRGDPLPRIDVTKVRGYDKSNDVALPPARDASLVPSRGTKGPSIAPPNGTERPVPVPSHGAIRPALPAPPVPPHGHHLDKPSAGVCVGAPGVGVQAVSDPWPIGKKSSTPKAFAPTDQTRNPRLAASTSGRAARGPCAEIPLKRKQI